MNIKKNKKKYKDLISNYPEYLNNKQLVSKSFVEKFTNSENLRLPKNFYIKEDNIGINNSNPKETVDIIGNLGVKGKTKLLGRTDVYGKLYLTNPKTKKTICIDTNFFIKINSKIKKIKRELRRHKREVKKDILRERKMHKDHAKEDAKFLNEQVQKVLHDHEVDKKNIGKKLIENFKSTCKNVINMENLKVNFLKIVFIILVLIAINSLKF